MVGNISPAEWQRCYPGTSVAQVQLSPFLQLPWVTLSCRASLGVCRHAGTAQPPPPAFGTSRVLGCSGVSTLLEPTGEVRLEFPPLPPAPCSLEMSLLGQGRAHGTLSWEEPSSGCKRMGIAHLF